MKTRLILVLCVVVSSVLAAPSAMAATLSMDTGDLVYEAAAGEVNAVVMTNGAIITDVVLTDTGAGTITDLSGKCDVVGNAATCHLATVHNFIVALADKNDTYNATSCTNCFNYSDTYWLYAFGGAGNDTLTGSSRDDYLIGEQGADTMNGLGGDDWFFADSIKDGSDTINGGAGADVADYGARTRAVALSLDGRRNDGQSGENDKIGSDVEDVAGGAGNDTLTGSSAMNYMWGGPGADLIVGGAGADHLFGEAGNDTLKSRDTSQDRVDGGVGTDTSFRDSKDRVVKVERFG